MAIIFVTYATERFAANAKTLASSALSVGFDEALILSSNDIADTQFGRTHRKVLTAERGAGYWLWKPYIIKEAICNIGSEDIVFYCDAGRSNYYAFSSLPVQLIDKVRGSEEGILLGPSIPHLGPLSQWTKRDCLEIMGAEAHIVESPPLVAGWSLWRRTSRALDFVGRWLSYCENEDCLTDQPNKCGLPNHEGFRDHRHDQSILSILAHSERAPYLNFADTLVHRLINLRPRSALGHAFYKRPQNANDLLASDNPLLLVREFMRLRNAR